MKMLVMRGNESLNTLWLPLEKREREVFYLMKSIAKVL